MSKILVTGGNGMLGSAVKEVFKDDDLILTDIDTLDVRDYKQVMAYGDLKPELIMHLAALTDLEYCERYPADAYMTNHTGTVNVMLLARQLAIPMVFISTAGIFDGKRISFSYDDYDIPNPINNYGRSKYFSEMALKNYDKVWTFRASWMMGGGPGKDKKFINLIYNQIKSGRTEIFALDDTVGSPTYTFDLANTIKNVIDKKADYGVYNCAGEGAASRYDIAKLIIEILKPEIKIIPVKDNFFKNIFACPRSKGEVLENYKLNRLGLSKMRSWNETVKEYIEKCYMP